MRAYLPAVPEPRGRPAVTAATMAGELQHEEPARGKVFSNGSTKTTVRKRVSSQTRKGVGDSLAGDGDCSRRHEADGCCATRRWADVAREEAADILAQRLAAAGSTKAPIRSRVTFRTLANEWQATVLPMYKQSTQKNHRHISEKHLVPRFGDMALSTSRGRTSRPTWRISRRRVTHRRRSTTFTTSERGASHGREVGPVAGEPGARASTCRRSRRPAEVGADGTQAA